MVTLPFDLRRHDHEPWTDCSTGSKPRTRFGRDRMSPIGFPIDDLEDSSGEEIEPQEGDGRTE